MVAAGSQFFFCYAPSRDTILLFSGRVVCVLQNAVYSERATVQLNYVEGGREARSEAFIYLLTPSPSFRLCYHSPHPPGGCD